MAKSPSWWEDTLAKSKEKLTDKTAELIASIIIAAVIYLLSNYHIQALWPALGLLAISLIIVIIGVIIRRRRRPSLIMPDPPIQVYDPAKRRIDLFKTTVKFRAGRYPEEWEIEERLTCTGRSGEIKAIPASIRYDSGMSDLEVSPLNAQGSPYRIEIHNQNRLSEQQYNFMIRLIPSLKPRKTCDISYSLKPIDPGEAPPYVFTSSPSANSKIGETIFRVTYAPDALPKGNTVLKAYWPHGVGYQGGKYIEVDSDTCLVDPQTRTVIVRFTAAEIEKLDQKYDSPPELRHYGLIWKWPEHPAADIITQLRRRWPSSR